MQIEKNGKKSKSKTPDDQQSVEKQEIQNNIRLKVGIKGKDNSNQVTNFSQKYSVLKIIFMNSILFRKILDKFQRTYFKAICKN